MFRGRLCDWRMRSIRAVASACAVTTTVAGDARGTVPEDRFAAWEPSLSVKVGGGYKDNVALSQARPESSAFLRTSLDAVAVRLPVDGTQATFLLLGEDTRYFSSKAVDHEDFLLGQAELRRFWVNDWQAALAFEGIYLDQVIDLSVTETNQTRLVVKAGTLVVRPSVRRELTPEMWLTLESPFTRQMFDGLPDDYWVAAPRVTIGRAFGNASEVSLAYEFAFRHYDTERARELDRSVITNETRVSFQHEIQAAWKHHWDAPRRFRTSAKASYRVSSDGAGGYFDYDRTQVSGQLRYRGGPWELSIEGRVAYYQFSGQKGSDGRDDRERLDAGVTLRGERTVARRVRVFCEYDYAETVSSLNLEEYAANTVLGGIGIEF